MRVKLYAVFSHYSIIWVSYMQLVFTGAFPEHILPQGNQNPSVPSFLAGVISPVHSFPPIGPSLPSHPGNLSNAAR